MIIVVIKELEQSQWIKNLLFFILNRIIEIDYLLQYHSNK